MSAIDFNPTERQRDMKAPAKTRRPSISVCVKALVDAGADVADIMIDRQNDRVYVKGGPNDKIDPQTGLDTSWQ